MADHPGPGAPPPAGGPSDGGLPVPDPAVPWDRDPTTWFTADGSPSPTTPPAPPPGAGNGTDPAARSWARPTSAAEPWYSGQAARWVMATAVAAVLSLVFLVALVAGRLGADPAPGSQLLAGEVRGAAVVAACVPARPASATVFDATITVGDLDRAYRLHLPRGYTGSEQVPLVLLLHGTGGTIDGFEEYTRFTDAAVARGYAVATPQGVGDPQGGVPAHWTVPGFPGPDDVAFVESLVREVAASSCIDLRRVYATGLSRGGAFSAYLGCQSTMFAALAPVAGANLVRPCAGPPVSVLAIHGTADPYVDYDGLDPEVAAVDDTFYNAPALDNAAAWAQRDGCTGQEEVSEAADVTRTTWLECADATSVQLLTITDGGHVWPGAGPRDVAQFGTTTTSISGNDVILDFFDAHTLAGPVPEVSPSATG